MQDEINLAKSLSTINEALEIYTRLSCKFDIDKRCYLYEINTETMIAEIQENLLPFLNEKYQNVFDNQVYYKFRTA